MEEVVDVFSHRGRANLFVGAVVLSGLLLGVHVLERSPAAQEGAGLTIRIFRAGEVAYRDFDERLARATDSSLPLSKFLGSMRNYEISLRDDGDTYIVTFLPTKFEGSTVRGGGAEYRIDKADLRVHDVIQFK
jgi:hypothetical protein